MNKVKVTAALLGASIMAATVYADVFIWSSPQSIPADGTSISKITAMVFNGSPSNPVPGVAVSFVASPEGAATLSGPNPVLTDVNGLAEIDLIAGTSPCNVFVGIAVEGQGGSNATVVTLKPLSTPTNQPPAVTASATPASGRKPLIVQFRASGTDVDGSIVSYAWTFGDQTSSTQQNPTHTYTRAGTYTATVTVTDNGGATASKSLVIRVTK